MRARARWIVSAMALFSALGLEVQPVWAQAAAPVTEGVQIDGEYGFGLPPDISTHGHQIDRLISIVHWFMAVLMIGWSIFFVHCLFRYRDRPGKTAQYELIKAKPAKASEIVVVVIEAVLLIGLSIPVWSRLKHDLPTEAENPVRIHVVAEQFMWRFHYPGADGIFGKRSPTLIDPATNPLGLDPDDSAGDDDIVASELHIPVDEPIICDLSSKDVIHSFSIPVMRIKQDTIPGMRIPVWFKTKPDTMGTYEVACAQLCGNNHYNMKALLKVQTRSDFDAWLAAKAVVEEFDEDEFD